MTVAFVELDEAVMFADVRSNDESAYLSLGEGAAPSVKIAY